MTTQIDDLYSEAMEQTLKTLPAFLQKISNAARMGWGYEFGMDAVAISAVAASHAMGREPGLGMSGASAGGVMWKYMAKYGNITTPARIIQYKKLLHPHNAEYFERTITSQVWAALQAMAEDKLKTSSNLGPTVRAHLELIVGGMIPFGYTLEA